MSNSPFSTTFHSFSKMHALDGHTIALFVVQELIHAAEELAVQIEGHDSHSEPATGGKETDNETKESIKPEDILKSLMEEEQSEFENFQKADLPELASQSLMV